MRSTWASDIAASRQSHAECSRGATRRCNHSRIKILTKLMRSYFRIQIDGFGMLALSDAMMCCRSRQFGCVQSWVSPVVDFCGASCLPFPLPPTGERGRREGGDRPPPRGTRRYT